VTSLKRDINELKESLQGFYESDESKLTVKELLTSTNNIVLPTMVQNQAIVEISNWVDAREIGRAHV
jgi:hypothetical protein